MWILSRSFHSLVEINKHSLKLQESNYFHFRPTVYSRSWKLGGNWPCAHNNHAYALFISSAFMTDPWIFAVQATRSTFPAHLPVLQPSHPHNECFSTEDQTAWDVNFTGIDAGWQQSCGSCERILLRQSFYWLVSHHPAECKVHTRQYAAIVTAFPTACQQYQKLTRQFYPDDILFCFTFLRQSSWWTNHQLFIVARTQSNNYRYLSDSGSQWSLCVCAVFSTQ